MILVMTKCAPTTARLFGVRESAKWIQKKITIAIVVKDLKVQTAVLRLVAEDRVTLAVQMAYVLMIRACVVLGTLELIVTKLCVLPTALLLRMALALVSRCISKHLRALLT